MPTARELLEQADALMRRNRADQVDDIPVLTDAVPSLAEAPVRALASTPAVASAQPEASGGPRGPGQSPPAPAHEGEPSDWLEIEDAEPSVIGDAPDSVAIVPPVEMRRATDEALLQSAEHEEIELTSAADDHGDDEADDHNGDRAGESVDDRTEGNGATGVAAVEPASTAEDPPAWAAAAKMPAALDQAGFPAASDDARVVEIVELAEFVELAPDAEAQPPAAAGNDGVDVTPGLPERPVAPPTPTAAPSAAVLAASFAAAMPAEPELPASLAADTRWPGTTATEFEAPEVDTSRASAVAPVPLGPDDQAHWDGVAEEIRMQVLQRIDLFTDTGLREQLGERLKPIVDRASADLVATINQHVGELLRAYVAETIEREIERWRQDN